METTVGLFVFSMVIIGINSYVPPVMGPAVMNPMMNPGGVHDIHPPPGLNYLDYSCFQCRDKCISYSWRCDGEVDCFGAEDESECEFICPYSTHHRCSDTGLCVDNHHLCDGHYDCENGEDERNCGRSWIGKREAPLDQDKQDSNI